MTLNEKIGFEMRSQRLLKRMSGIDWIAPKPSETVQNRLKWAFSVLFCPNLSDFSYQILATDLVIYGCCHSLNRQQKRQVYLPVFFNISLNHSALFGIAS